MGRNVDLFDMNPTTIRVTYTLVFASMGAVAPFLSVFYAGQAGLTTRHVGYLSALKIPVSFLGQPFWGFLADSTGKHKTILLTTTFVSTVLRLLIWVVVELGRDSLSSTQMFWALAVVSTSQAFWNTPIVSLMEVSILQWLEDPHNYGQYRLWGAIGFGIATGLSGLLASLVTDGNLALCFWLATALWLSALPLMRTFHFPETQVLGAEDAKAADDAPPMYKSLSLALAQKHMIAFLVLVSLSGFCMGLIDTYLFVWLAQLGGSSTCMGLARAITCFAEVPFFRFADKLIKRLGSFGVMVIVQIAYIVRLLYYSNLQSPWWVLPVEVLHGLTFAAMWATTSHYAYKAAPPGLCASVQGVTRGVHKGLGFGMGALLGGSLYESIGGAKVFQAGAGVAAVGLLVAALATLGTVEHSAEDQERGDDAT